MSPNFRPTQVTLPPLRGKLFPAEGDPPFLVGDLKRLQGELGWRPTIGIEEGLDRTIRWTREQLESEQVSAE